MVWASRSTRCSVLETAFAAMRVSYADGITNCPESTGETYPFGPFIQSSRSGRISSSSNPGSGSCMGGRSARGFCAVSRRFVGHSVHGTVSQSSISFNSHTPLKSPYLPAECAVATHAVIYRSHALTELSVKPRGCFHHAGLSSPSDMSRNHVCGPLNSIGISPVLPWRFLSTIQTALPRDASSLR